MKKAFILILTALLSFFIISGCNSSVYNQPVSSSSFMFDTVTNITIYAAKTDDDPQEILTEVTKLCTDLEKKLSKTIEGSDINRINESKGEPIKVSDETAELINLSKKYNELSKGAFDITISPLSDVWNFQNDKPTPPSDYEINTLLTAVGMDFINIEGNIVTKTNPNTEIDLGGIAKGYIADKTAEYLKSRNVTSALINFGGNIITIGSKTDGSNFKIGVQEPFAETNEICGAVSSENGTVVTSGTYQRYFEYNGQKYHHILDPKTGKPSESGLLSVTIEGTKSADADALSTACFVLGLDKGMELIESIDGVEAVFITDEYEIIKSKNSTFEEL